VCDVHRDSHVGKMEAVAEPDQTDGDDMVRNQLAEILPRLLEHQQQHDELLCPVARLQQVVCLEQRLAGPVRKILVHAPGVEVPDGCARHDPEPKGAVEAKVERRVGLLHEARLLRAALDAVVDGDGADQPLHAELAGEAQHHDVEADKGKVAGALAVVQRAVRVGAHLCGDERVIAVEGVRDEEAGGDGVRGVRVDEVEGDDEEGEQQRAEPRVPYALPPQLGEGAAHGATLRAAARLVCFLCHGECVLRRSAGVLAWHMGWGAYRALEADRAVQRRRALSRRRKGRHVDVAADVLAERARLPPPCAQALGAFAGVLARGAAERRERLRHGQNIITIAIRIYAGETEVVACGRRVAGSGRCPGQINKYQHLLSAICELPSSPELPTQWPITAIKGRLGQHCRMSDHHADLHQGVLPLRTEYATCRFGSRIWKRPRRIHGGATCKKTRLTDIKSIDTCYQYQHAPLNIYKHRMIRCTGLTIS
jgi:hypothetical protein